MNIETGNSQITTGDPVILTDDSGLQEAGLTKGQLGWANSITTVPGVGTYVFFMPKDGKQTYVIGAERLEVDEEAKAAGVTLNEQTIAKGD